MSTNQGFFYIDGIPTKGLWVDLDGVTEWEQIEEKLLDLFPNAQVDEILCADIEGLPRFFYASCHDSFSMDEWATFQEEIKGSHLEEEVIEAYLDNMGSALGVSVSDIEEAYQGEYKDWTDFAYEMVDSCGYLSDAPEFLSNYFDYEKFGRDLSYDYFESNGYYFRNL